MPLGQPLVAGGWLKSFEMSQLPSGFKASHRCHKQQPNKGKLPHLMTVACNAM